MALLEISQRSALVGDVLQVFLEKLKARAVLLDNFTPGFHPHGDVVLLEHKSAIPVGTTLNHASGVIRQTVRRSFRLCEHANH